MFIILIYDVESKRCGKILKICRKYLSWVQNSVLEGEISEANIKKLKLELDKIIHSDKDSVVLYNFRTLNYSKREVIGIENGGQINIL